MLDPVPDALTDDVIEAVSEPDAECEGLAPTESDDVGVFVTDCESEGVVDDVAVPLIVADGVGVDELVILFEIELLAATAAAVKEFEGFEGVPLAVPPNESVLVGDVVIVEDRLVVVELLSVPL